MQVIVCLPSMRPEVRGRSVKRFRNSRRRMRSSSRIGRFGNRKRESRSGEASVFLAAGSAEIALVMLILFREKLIDRVERLQPVLLQQNHVRAFADLDPSPISRGFVRTEIGVRDACPCSRSTPRALGRAYQLVTCSAVRDRQEVRFRPSRAGLTRYGSRRDGDASFPDRPPMEARSET
jgi:hypothetical protein